MNTSTAYFREEHRRLYALLDELPEPAGEPNAGRTYAVLAILTERLADHVDAQIADLCPPLMQHPDAAVRVRVVAFAGRTSAFMRFYREFIGRWPSRSAALEASVEYLDDAQMVVSALHAHLRDEEVPLYDLIDALAAV